MTLIQKLLYLLHFWLSQLTIQGTIGQAGYSDIAIDDVYIDPGLCSE